MDVEKTMHELAQYFKGKMIEGDYMFVKCDEYTAEVLVDGKYPVKLWISNNPKNNCNIYDPPTFESHVNLWEFASQKERLKAWRAIKPHVEKHNREILKKEKAAQIARLEAELKKL